MFTGIVRDIGTIVSIRSDKTVVHITVKLKSPFKKVRIGSSIAINGVCLTVTKIFGSEYSFDVVEETLLCTNLHLLKKGMKVHVESSAKLGDEIGGHLVSGHVSTTAKLVKKEKSVFTFTISPVWIPYIQEKGFLALDGCSLTVHHIDTKKHTFSFSCIPETLKSTLFGKKEVGESVNVEIDPVNITTVNFLKNFLKNKI